MYVHLRITYKMYFASFNKYETAARGKKKGGLQFLKMLEGEGRLGRFAIVGCTSEIYWNPGGYAFRIFL